MPPKKPAGNAVQAEVSLHQSLKNCLVNLPSSLVSVLVNANTVCDLAATTTLRVLTVPLGRPECRR